MKLRPSNLRYEKYLYDFVSFNAQQFQQIKDLVPGKFYLKAMTEDFSKSVPLYLNAQRVSLLIQINKPVFRTDDNFEFRIFALDSRTKPYKINDTSKIWILDPVNNQVKTWNDPTFVRGLVEGNLLLADAEPGTWKLLVEADGQVRSIYC